MEHELPFLFSPFSSPLTLSARGWRCDESEIELIDSSPPPPFPSFFTPLPTQKCRIGKRPLLPPFLSSRVPSSRYNSSRKSKVPPLLPFPRLPPSERATAMKQIHVRRCPPPSFFSSFSFLVAQGCAVDRHKSVFSSSPSFFFSLLFFLCPRHWEPAAADANEFSPLPFSSCWGIEGHRRFAAFFFLLSPSSAQEQKRDVVFPPFFSPPPPSSFLRGYERETSSFFFFFFSLLVLLKHL